MENISFFWIFLIVITCGFGAILYLLVTHNSEEKPEESPAMENKTAPQKDVIKDLTDRQKKIMVFLQEKKMAKPPELRKIAGDVSSRTVRRDMDVLVAKGLVSQEGTTKSTYYKCVIK